MEQHPAATKSSLFDKIIDNIANLVGCLTLESLDPEEARNTRWQLLLGDAKLVLHQVENSECDLVRCNLLNWAA